jgi:3-hydroxybutyryl-CoA dehydrogenase
MKIAVITHTSPVSSNPVIAGANAASADTSPAAANTSPAANSSASPAANADAGPATTHAQSTPAIAWSDVFPAASPEWVLVNTPGEAERQQDIDLYIDLDFTMDQSRIEALSRLLPAPVLIHAVVPTLKEIGRPFIRINAWPGFLERSIHELVFPNETTALWIKKIYGQLDKQYRSVPDIPGMISGRVLASIINEACYTLQEEVSTAPEIDTAMRLGTNYPLGPFEWCERIGWENIDELLTLLSKTESRYIPAGTLKKAANGIKIGLKNLKS